MLTRGEAGGLGILPRNGVDDALVLFLDLLRQRGLGRFVAARDFCGLDQEVEEEQLRVIIKKLSKVHFDDMNMERVKATIVSSVRKGDKTCVYRIDLHV